jgi:hypothetical protein
MRHQILRLTSSRGRDFYQTLCRPCLQIRRLPDCQRTTSFTTCNIPAVYGCEAQVGRDEVEFIVLRRTDDEWVADTFCTECGIEDCITIVDYVPVQGIISLADGCLPGQSVIIQIMYVIRAHTKIDLFP